METLTPEQIKSRYGIGITSKSEVLTPGEVKAKYGLEEEQTKEPSLGGKFLRGVLKTPARLATNLVNAGQIATGKETTQPFSGDYLGEVKAVGQSGDFVKDVKDSIGAGLEMASYLPVARGAKALGTLAKEPFKKAVIQSGKQVAKEGAFGGGASMMGNALMEDKGIGDTLVDTAKGVALGGLTGFGLGAGGSALSRGLTKTPKDFTSQLIDKDIRKVFEGTTADTAKLDDMAFKSRKGLELLVNESPTIKIPDTKAPLGSGATKGFDIEKATPNEFLSAVSGLTQKVVSNAKTAVKEASEKGFNLDTEGAKQIIIKAVANGDIPNATGSRILKQIENTQGNPEKLFDWVQDVNVKYKNRFDKGTIDDMATSRIANDVAESFRKELNSITDRTGYAENMANIADMKRMLIAVAKKANKNINFGDITSEAGLDAGIALLTGNPAYMARTLASGIFKGLVGKIRNTAGIRNVKSAVKNIQKIPNDQKLPSLKLKQEIPKTREIIPDFKLIGEDAKIQNASISKYKANPQKLTQDYIKANGKVVNTDQVRKLFKDVGYKGTNAAAVQEASSAVAKDAWEELLRTSKTPDSLIYAGGSGTGKTSAVRNILFDEVTNAGAILDGNLSTMKSAQARINESVKAGKYPTVVYVYRDPVDSWINGVIKRMTGNVEEGGRVVPLSVFLENHKGSYDVVRDLLKNSELGKSFDLKMVDNSMGKNNQTLLERSKFDNIRYNDNLGKELKTLTKNLYDKGTITKTQYEALIK